MEKVINPIPQSKSREPVRPPEVGLSRRKNYQAWSKEELVREIQKLEKRKKYGLVWEDKPEEVAELCKEKLPVLVEDELKEIKSSQIEPTNILIEGDNYHALSVLNYTHKGKIDVIYVDPPYNTGNKTWKYNNRFIDREDPFKHSRWLSFVSKRLNLAKHLLKPSGIIVVTIDDYEVFTLGMLMDEIFGESNRLANITVLNKKSGRTTDKHFATCHEYYLVYAKNASYAKIELFGAEEDDIAEYRFEDEVSKYRWRDFLRTGGFSTPKERPNSYYPIYYNPQTEQISLKKFDGSVEILPIDSRGNKRVWRQTRPSFTLLVEQGDIKIEKNRQGLYSVKIKDRVKSGFKPKTVWDDPKYDAATHGTKLLESILGTARTFEFPKSLYAVLDVLKITVKNNKAAVILDFFAGSGTTGHAVLELNKEDDGQRTFILCTNNEDNNGMGLKIASDICYPRIKRVIEGYKNIRGENVEALGGKLKYFKTDFVDAIQTDRNKKRLVDKSTEMLCLKEDCFDEVKRTAGYAIFENGQGKHLGIVYDDDGIDSFKKEARKLNRKMVVYVFSLDESAREEELKDVEKLVELKPIPAVILSVYKRIFR